MPPKQTKIQDFIVDDLEYIMFRVSRVQNLKMEELYKKFDKYQKNIVALEVSNSGVIHLQGIVAHAGLSVDEVRADIKDVFKDAKGNKCLYVSKVQDRKSAIKYNLKDGKYLYKGFTAELIKKMSNLSYKNAGIDEKIKENEELLISREISFLTFQENHIQILLDYGRNLYNNHIRAYFNRFQLKSGQISIRDYIENNFQN